MSLYSWYTSFEGCDSRSISSVISSIAMARFCTSALYSGGPASHRCGGTSALSFFSNSRWRGSGWWAATLREVPSGCTSEKTHQSPNDSVTFCTMRRSGSISSGPT